MIFNRKALLNIIPATAWLPPAFAGLFLLINLQSCGPESREVHPVERVIGSMTDSLPRIPLPEDADPENENWKGIDLEPKPPVLPLYPEEQAAKFLLPPGYSIEPVLTEPQIEQPGAIAFDGNGRMYVLELRTYMLTADSDGTLEPISRISRWEDKDNDGVYESGTTFVDKLIFPRFVLPYGKDCILTMETDADNVYKYTDTDGDGVADKKEFFTNKYGRSGNVEHQQAFMYRGMDNWLYSTVNAFRVRETPGGVIREKTGYNRAQWGITHDDDGKLWFQGGASGLPSYFQFPIHYGNFKVENEFAEGFEIPWGAAVKIADMQGGMDEVRQPDGSLNRVTGAAGNDIFRGDRLPRELYGQYFYGEPVARIVRRVRPVVEEGLTTLHNVYQGEKSEFLRSTDPLFRPVDMTTAPDGTLYITDMYHGIIQEGEWAQKGTYLRAKIEQYQLDKVVGLGRIWRISHEKHERDATRPDMFNQTPQELLAHLEHPNGWWRDKAQQLLVQAGDRSVVPALRQMASTHNNPLSRIHAIWTLEGLGALEDNLISELMADKNPRIRIQALRASETIYRHGKKSLLESYWPLLEDTDPDVAIQAMLTAKYLKLPGLEGRIKTLMADRDTRGIKVIGQQLLNPEEDNGFGDIAGLQFTPVEKERIEKGSVIFNELCVQCHGANGTGTDLGNGSVMAPSLRGSPRVQSHPEYVIKAIMHGLEGPLDGKSYPAGIMVGNKEQSDEWIAAISSYIRLGLTNEASLVDEQQVAKVREQTKGKEGPYTFEDLMASVPQVLPPENSWKLSASHTAPTRIGGTASPRAAFNFEGWTTGEQQKPGMWFQVELPGRHELAEIHFNAPPIRKGWGPDAPDPIQTYPRAYKLELSDDGKSWQEVAAGQPASQEVKIVFPPVRARFIRITETGTPEDSPDVIPWSMRQLRIYGYPTKQEAVN